MMYWIHPDHPDAHCIFYSHLRQLTTRYNKKKAPLAFVCIGSPLVLGDCLGPIIGTILSQNQCRHVYGTLAQPIHALNLSTACMQLNATDEPPFVIAIDAALGTTAQTGYITIKKGPLFPGKGVGKKLPPIGDIQITGVFDDLTTPSATHLLASFGRCISAGLLQLDTAFQCAK